MSDLTTLLKATGTQVRFLARETGWTVEAVRRWQNGTARTPEPVLVWLRRRLADPPPRREDEL